MKKKLFGSAKSGAGSDSDNDSSPDQTPNMDQDDFIDPLPVYSEATQQSGNLVTAQPVHLSELLTARELKLRPDILSQYLVQRRQWNTKSADNAADEIQGSTGVSGALSKLFKGKGKEKEGQSQAGESSASTPVKSAYLDVETRRVYLPGSQVHATVRVPEKFLVDGTYDKVTCELKGVVRRHAIVHDQYGNENPVWQDDEIFSHHATLWSSQSPEPASSKSGLSMEAQDGPDHYRASATALPEPLPLVDLGDGTTCVLKSWLFDTQLPTALPSTFKDRGAMSKSSWASNQSNWIVYLVKVTCFSPRKLKKNARIWTPILVVSPQAARSENHLFLPRSLPPLNPSQPGPPPGWNWYRAGKTLRNKLMMQKGSLIVDIYLSESSNTAPPGSHEKVAFLMKAIVFAKDADDLADASTLLPALSGSDGAGESQPRLALRRTDWSRARGVEKTASKEYPIEVEWTRPGGELPLGPGETAAELNVGTWSEIKRLNEAEKLDEAADRIVKTKSQTRTLLPKAVPEIPSGWSYRTALLGGTMVPGVSPTIALEKLKISYSVLFRWDGLKENVADIVVGTGFTAADIEAQQGSSGVGTGASLERTALGSDERVFMLVNLARP